MSESGSQESEKPERAKLDPSQVEPLIEAARTFEIAVEPERVLETGAVWGRVGDIKVAMGVRFVSGLPVGYAHYAEAPDPVLGPVTVQPWTGQARGRQLTGDDETDSALSMHGEPPTVRAWLDAPTRAHLVELFAPIPRPTSLEISRRRVTFRGPETMAVDAARVVADVKVLVALVEGARLSSRPQLERVVHNALEDPEAEVRERNAAVLGELIPSAGEDARYGAAVRLLLTDRIALDHRLDVFRIVRALPPERLAPLMQRVLEEGPIELVRRAVSWATETENAETVHPLVKVLRRFDDRSLMVSVVEALAKIEDVRAQPALLNLLGRDDEALRLQVVQALGRIGNEEAVAEISPFTKGLFTDRELKKVAKEAVEAIQGRAATADNA